MVGRGADRPATGREIELSSISSTVLQTSLVCEDDGRHGRCLVGVGVVVFVSIREMAGESYLDSPQIPLS